MPKLALLSVADKTGVVAFARDLVELGFDLVASAGTARELTAAGLAVTSTEELTGFSDALDGLVKTLHPVVHGAILARRDLPHHLVQLAEAGVSPIDIVVVNFSPVRATAERPGATDDEVMAQIDIGGPALARSAAQNHSAVTVVVDPADYAFVTDDLRRSGMTQMHRQQLAAKAFALTAAYDADVAEWMARRAVERTAEGAPNAGQSGAPTGLGIAVPKDLQRLVLAEPEALRYGENPHQSAILYRASGGFFANDATAQLLQGEALSYSNLVDADTAWAVMTEVDATGPAAVVVQRGNPCGLGFVPTSVAGALLRAIDADMASAVGGVLAVNRPFDLPALRALGSCVMEVVVAPSFDEEVLEELALHPKLRLLRLGPSVAGSVRKQVHSTIFGTLVQDADVGGLDVRRGWVAGSAAPTETQWRALELAWVLSKYVKSHAIIVGNETGSLGIGAGQMSQADAAVIAVGKARRGQTGLVAASDGALAGPASVEALARGGVKAIAQPGGSPNDPEVIAAANAAGIALVMTGVRHFRA